MTPTPEQYEKAKKTLVLAFYSAEKDGEYVFTAQLDALIALGWGPVPEGVIVVEPANDPMFGPGTSAIPTKL